MGTGCDSVSLNKCIGSTFRNTRKAEELGIIDNSSGAIVSSKIEADEKSKPHKYLSLDGSSTDWGVKQNTDGNKIAWFGFKLHIAMDTKSELLIALKVTPASVHDSNMALAMINQVKENVKIPPRSRTLI